MRDGPTHDDPSPVMLADDRVVTNDPTTRSGEFRRQQRPNGFPVFFDGRSRMLW